MGSITELGFRYPDTEDPATIATYVQRLAQDVDEYIRTELPGSFAAKDSPEITGAPTFPDWVGFGEVTPRARNPHWSQYTMNAADADAESDENGSTVTYQRTSIWKGDFKVKATVTISAVAGTVPWTIGGQTAHIAYNASAATVDAALEALSSVGAGNVTVTGGAGGPYEVTYSELFIQNAGFRELTVGAGASIDWVNKFVADTGHAFGENVYVATGTADGDGDGIGFFYGSIIEATHRSDARLGTFVGLSGEASWSGADGDGPIARMIGIQAIAGRHKNHQGAGILGDATATEVYTAYIHGAPEGRSVTDAVTTNGSPTVTSATARFTTLAHRGRKVTGTGIPANTYILSVDSATQVTLSNNCTASATITMTLAAIAGASTARTALFGYGTVEFQGRTDHKPSYKNEPAARWFAYAGAAAADAVWEQYDHTGTRKGYGADLGFLAMKHNIIAQEGSSLQQVAMGSLDIGGGTFLAAMVFGSAGDALVYRPGANQLSTGVDDTFRPGRFSTLPTASSVGAGAVAFYTVTGRLVCSDGTNWKYGDGTTV